MNLISVKYTRHRGQVNEWSLVDFQPQQINLVVGKNASGKTRTLNVIASLAHLLCGDYKGLFEDSLFDFSFRSSEGKLYRYLLDQSAHEVLREELYVEGELRLKREGARAELYFAELGQAVKVEVPKQTVMAVNRRDPLQHPFFEELYYWGLRTLHYRFGTVFGRNRGLVLLPSHDTESGAEDYEIDLRKTDNVVELFLQGQKKFDGDFVDLIIEDMGKISYALSGIEVKYAMDLSMSATPSSHPAVLAVQECDLNCLTYQHKMSQGMFRALSLIIQLNLSKLESEPGCIIIDDIGEGLDYERSSQLIQLLVDKVQGTEIQLIMSTNDRFVMNNVDLEYWSIIERKGHDSRIYNSRNAKEVFEDFEFTGLCNFDLLSSGFFSGGEEILDEEE